MKNISRSDFLKTMGGLFVIPKCASTALHKKYQPHLSFSTIGCPDWPLEEIIDFAAHYKYAGVEIRGVQRELDLSNSKYFNSDTAIAETLKRFNDRNIKIVGLGSSCELHHQNPEVRQKNIDEAKRFIGIAEKLKCPYVRVFPNNFVAGQPHEKTIEVIATGLSELGDYAKRSGVKVLMETHGDVLHSDDILKIMSLANNGNTGIIWDLPNMWTMYKEAPITIYAKLKKYICHTHIKDLTMESGKEVVKFPGEGEVPIFEMMDILASHNYNGYFSFEWEKLWHPEIDEPVNVLSKYPSVINNYFSKR